MNTLLNTATGVAHDWISGVLVSLGVMLLPHEFFGGMFLSLACASMVWQQRRRRRSGQGTFEDQGIWSAIGTAFIFSSLVAIAWPALGENFPGRDIPVQGIMAITGLASGWLMDIIVNVGDHVEDQSDEIADRVVDKFLPPRSDSSSSSNGS